MFEDLPPSTDATLAVHFSGKITGPEYQQFLDALEPRLKAGSKVNVVFDLTGAEFYGDFAAAKKDWTFAFGEYQQLHRAAFVGDQKWIELFTGAIGPLIRVEEKHFPAGQLDQALAWTSV